MASLHSHHDQHNISQILGILMAFSCPIWHVFVSTYLMCILLRRSTRLVMIIPFTSIAFMYFNIIYFISLCCLSLPGLCTYKSLCVYLSKCVVCLCFEKKCFFKNNNSQLKLLFTHHLDRES